MTEFIYQPGKLGDEERRKAAQADWTTNSFIDMQKLEAKQARAKEKREQEIAYHYVKVEVEGERVSKVTFTCTAPDDAECRTYPDCTCDQWEWDEDDMADQSGHPREHGMPCWVKGWFGADAAVYIGDDHDEYRDDSIPANPREGHIKLQWVDEWVEWNWAEPVEEKV